MISSTTYSERLLRIGHRGAAGHAPENTLASFERAIQFGVDFVEFDVRRSEDGALVLVHDRTVDRTTNGKGCVAFLPLRILRKLDAGRGEHIPLLEEAFNCLNGRAGAMIELKVKGIAAEVCAAVKAAHFQGPIMVASFFHEELWTVRQLMTEALTVSLYKASYFHSPSIDTQPMHAGLALKSVPHLSVETLRGHHPKVFIYTVDAPEDIERVKRLGVDGIISNFPDRL